jgi:type II secretory pathway pseudopilin PulG
VAAFSLLEVLFVLGTVATVSVVAVPEALTTIDDARAGGAARFVANRLLQARSEAVQRSRIVALRFDDASGTYTYSAYLDGNHNGVLAREIQSGIDRQIESTDTLRDRFMGVDFCTVPDLPAVDPASAPPGDDPIRFGSSDMVSFTPLGTATPGTLYICGRRNAQYAVRVYGETGKVRILKFNPASRQWTLAAL